MDTMFIEDFANTRVSKFIELMGALEHLNDPQCELVLLRVSMGLTEGPGFGALQWRLTTLPICAGELGVYISSDARLFALWILVFNQLICRTIFCGNVMRFPLGIVLTQHKILCSEYSKMWI
ncbi:hypothetical protein POM88_036657 [Heracleum sosnowskyi]|uniref:Uncharacterized protein n=1 Tax=Heracleum sosnowskyi TaxID=360622 RepID=A0AAD8HNK7_9APIA|nr:hypothetical protein POM88_036657 [Heracleum sosnowskyi]